MARKIVITGGHATPAIAVIKKLLEQGNWDVHFLGRRYETEGEQSLSLEAKQIPELGVRFYPLTAGKWKPKLRHWALADFCRLPYGFLQSLYYLVKIRPQVILSFGGYLSVPVVIAGWFLRIPSLTHEQTTVVGMGTNINQYFSKKIAVSWPDLSWRFPSNKVVLTGNPISHEFLRKDESIWRLFHFNRRLPLILITGGKQGSHAINEAVSECLYPLLSKYNIFHQTGHQQGTGDFEKLENKRTKLPVRAQKRYHLKKFLYGREWGTLLAKADLVISRSGINILTELASLGKPMLLVPFPWLYHNEQYSNAVFFKKRGVAEIILQQQLTPNRLCREIEKMFADMNTYRRNGNKIKKLVKKDAAQKIIEEIQKIS